MSWPLVKLAEVATLNPRLPKWVNESQEVSFLAMASVSEEGKILNQERRILAETKKGFTYFERNDVIVAKITPCFENGKAAFLDRLETQVGFGSTEFHVLRPNSDELDGKYLFYLIWNIQLRSVGERNMTGSAGQKRVPTSFFKDLKIPLPPLEEQKRIATILGKADDIRRKRKQAIQLADDFLRSVFLEMFGDPVTNPKGFPIGTIRDLVESANYGSSGKASVELKEFPILRMGNITYKGHWDFSSLKYIDLNEKEQQKYLVRKGDLLFNRTNSKDLVGKTAVYREDEPMAIAGYLIRVRTNELGNTEYISSYLNSKHGKQTLLNMCKSIVGMANINAQEMQNIKICIPPKALQDKFADIVDEVVQRTKKMTTGEEQLNELFSSLSQKAFSGQL
ncbi:type I restriction enzyme, S subunit [Ferrimonas sediminum]|uniref:Type I restriction enzyme, S subunit n=1 Tax=Ferrimonas sediminum TaxID=718193 RepID=A0A1G8UW51_9GAMM|nr:restriction endonuclease subunit S [Ferrimonas sediminum]SDJ58092.1 type I restriction enzyme, S subunit [Ferrimonas sediminum]